ncbi:CTB family bacteriocin [Fischerella sp. JS2]|uniref:CTB family bacteriocin n=1 Tax=Fischerella sp. JS2 TaxID=2597771 RepID=UPI0028ED8922|nr:CTB family bacteriocin [Fischerella sp. JS2]
MSKKIKTDEDNKITELSEEELDEVSGGLNLSELFKDINQFSQVNIANFKQSKFVLDQVSIVNSEGSFNSLHIEITNIESTAIQDLNIS